MSPSDFITWFSPVVNTPTASFLPTSIFEFAAKSIVGVEPAAYSPLENIPTELSPTFICPVAPRFTVLP